MGFDPDQEYCQMCGREPEECVCGLAPDLADDFGSGLDSDEFDWDYDEEEDDDEIDW